MGSSRPSLIAHRLPTASSYYSIRAFGSITPPRTSPGAQEPRTPGREAGRHAPRLHESISMSESCRYACRRAPAVVCGSARSSLGLGPNLLLRLVHPAACAGPFGSYRSPDARHRRAGRLSTASIRLCHYCVVVHVHAPFPSAPCFFPGVAFRKTAAGWDNVNTACISWCTDEPMKLLPRIPPPSHRVTGEYTAEPSSALAACCAAASASTATLIRASLVCLSWKVALLKTSSARRGEPVV